MYTAAEIACTAVIIYVSIGSALFSMSYQLNKVALNLFYFFLVATY